MIASSREYANPGELNGQDPLSSTPREFRDWLRERSCRMVPVMRSHGAGVSREMETAADCCATVGNRSEGTTVRWNPQT